MNCRKDAELLSDAHHISGTLSHPQIPIRIIDGKEHNRHQPYRDIMETLPALSPAARSRRVLLLEPNIPEEAQWGSMAKARGFLPPLGSISVYAFLKHRGFDVTFLDTQFGDYPQNRLRTFLSEGRFAVVGIPVMTSGADFSFQTARLVRQVLPEAVIILGNIHASSQPELTLAQCPEADYIVKHEGEFTVDALLRALADGTPAPEEIEGLAFLRHGRMVETTSRPFIDDLDALPLGMFADLDLQRYIPHPNQYHRLPNYPLVTQRGCPFPCTYCEASVILGKKIRFFSPERVIEELKILKYEKGARGVYFQDSTFSVRRDYAMRLMELMIREKLELLWTCNTRADRVDDELLDAMRQAGCRQISLGIESGNQSSLDLIRKQTTVEAQTEGVRRIHRHRIATACTYILCLPGEDEEMAMRTVEYARSLASRTALFFLPIPFPGSRLYQACQDDGGLRPTEQWSDYYAVDFTNPVYVNPRIGRERMQAIHGMAYKRFYSDPRVWLSNLKALTWGIPLKPMLLGFKAFLAFNKQR